MIKEKPVWIVIGNRDTTEGRGLPYTMYVCDKKETAKRLAAGKGVQGSNCSIRESIAFRRKGHNCWFAPADIVAPSTEDIRLGEINRAAELATSRARELGLGEDEIAAIRRGHGEEKP